MSAFANTNNAQSVATADNRDAILGVFGRIGDGCDSTEHLLQYGVRWAVSPRWLGQGGPVLRYRVVVMKGRIIENRGRVVRKLGC